ncbi:MAG: homoserine kinase [Elusimicrobia bacterium]|nr:homoserine kinase [Elusimicrobiota bacterium]
MKSVYIRVPASSGNLGPGFDVLAAGLKLYQELEAHWTTKQGVELHIEGESEESLSTPSKNMVCQILFKFLGKKIKKQGLFLQMKNGIPLARGLGSSAAASLAAFTAVEMLSGSKNLQRALERTIQKEGHPDNAVASFCGGLVSCGFWEKQLKTCAWKLPSDLTALIAVPDIKLSTEKARKILPRTVPRQHAVSNMAGISGMLWSLSHRNYQNLKRFMQDFLHQPYRQKLVPGMRSVIQSALEAGALGAALSGAGPSILAICHSKGNLNKIGRCMKDAFKHHGLSSRYQILDFDNRGLHIDVA